VVPDPDLRALTFHFRAGLTSEEHMKRISAIAGVRREELLFMSSHSSTLPSPAVGHAEIVSELDARLPGTGLYLVGNYFGGLAIEDCALRAAAEARRSEGELQRA
jgi:protoporphyrinogen oxidase